MNRAVAVVVWADAHQATEGWTEIGDLADEGERIIVSTGLLLTVGDGGKERHVSLAQSFDAGEDMVDNVLHIPRDMVRVFRIMQINGDYELVPNLIE